MVNVNLYYFRSITNITYDRDVEVLKRSNKVVSNVGNYVDGGDFDHSIDVNNVVANCLISYRDYPLLLDNAMIV